MCAWCATPTAHANWQGIGGRCNPADPEREEPRDLRIDGVDHRGQPHLVRRRGRAAAHRRHRAQSNYGRDRAAASRSRTRKSRARCTWTASRRRACRSISRCPKAALAEDYSQLDVDEFELSFGGFEARGQRAAEARASSRSSRARSTPTTSTCARCSTSVGIAAAEDHRSRGAGQAAARRDLGFRCRRRSASTRSRSTLDDTHFTGNFQPRRRRGCRSANLRCAAIRSTSRGTFRPPIPRASRSCCPPRRSRRCKFRGADRTRAGDATRTSS